MSKRYLQTKFMPYGMAVLTAYLKEQGIPTVQYDFLMEYLFGSPDDLNVHDPAHSVTEEAFFAYLDGRGSKAALKAFVEKYGRRLIPDASMYAFSIVAYHQFWAALLLTGYIRRINPDAVIVYGGPFITIRPVDSFVPYGGADYWIKGSGEVPLTLLYRMHTGDPSVSLDDVPGLVRHDGSAGSVQPQSRLAAVEEQAPDFSGLSLEWYRYDHPLTGEQTLFLPYRTTKGCSSRCSFCTGRLVDRFDAKPVDKVITELKDLARRHGTSTFQFADASINGHPRRLAELCDRLGREFPEIRWYAYARVNGFSRELLRKVKAAGCFSLFWGVESAYQPTVKMLGKRFEVEEVSRLIDESIALGIKSFIHIMYNTPHETQGDVDAFMRLVERYVHSDLVVFLPQRFLLEPQSLMWERPEQFGLRDVRRMPTTPFEREQYTYGEVDGPDADGVTARNERHRSLLRHHLDWIMYRSLLSATRHPLARKIPAELLVRSAGLAERNGLVRAVHRRALRWIASHAPAFQEQL